MKLGITKSRGLKASAAGALLSLSLGAGAFAQQQPPAIPDAPAPQKAPSPLTDSANGPIKPGGGAGTETSSSGSSGTGGSGSTETRVPAPSTQAPASQPQRDVQTTPPETTNPTELGTILRTYTTYVNVPVTVKDSKGKQVPGLTWRDFKVYENGNYEPLKFFIVDAFPLSMA